MIDTILEHLAVVDALLWGPWTMAFLAGVSVFFTVRSGIVRFQILIFLKPPVARRRPSGLKARAWTESVGK